MDSPDQHPAESGSSHSRDDDDIDFTSDYEMSSASSGFTSLEAATKYHVFENGRRYQAFLEGRYPLPNDESEQNREEIKHSMTKVITGGALGMAPVGDSPQKIIDLGTGSGIWAIEAGDYYPSAHILGVDLSPIQPYFAPPNVEWKIDDLEADWPSAYRNTDYIHGRCFVNTLRDPHKLVVSAYDHLRPGGWLEFGDIWSQPHCGDEPLRQDSILSHFFNLINNHFRSHYGWYPLTADELPRILADAGFVNIHVRREKLPLGPWCRTKGDTKMRELGLYMQLLMDGLVTATLAKHREFELTMKEAQILVAQAERAVRDPAGCEYLWWTSVWAQKPGGAAG